MKNEGKKQTTQEIAEELRQTLDRMGHKGGKIMYGPQNPEEGELKEAVSPKETK